MKIDVHVHSKFSKRPSQWILQKLGCPESFTEPLALYRAAKKRGMSLVTVTDHNTINGGLEIAHLEDVFISEEVTTYFPQDRCKIHVLVYNINEQIHDDIQKVRENIFDLVGYLNEHGIVHAVAHPLFAVNERLTIDHVEVLLLLFKNLELNGARGAFQNQTVEFILSQLTSGDIERLAEKHKIMPRFPRPWEKNLIGGSDDHSALNIARMYTSVDSADGVQTFLKGIELGQARVMGRSSSPQAFAQNLYGIAYQFYKNKLNLDSHVNKDLTMRFVDHFLHPDHAEETGLWDKIYCLWNHRRRPKEAASKPESVEGLLRYETQKLIWDDPQLMAIAKNGNCTRENDAQKWFQFVNNVSDKVLYHFGNHLLDHLSGANLFNVFHSIGSTGALYTMLAPYFVAFSLFTKDRQLSRQARRVFSKDNTLEAITKPPIRVAHFTDTYHEVNGVALTLQQMVRQALNTGKELTVITCDGQGRRQAEGVKNFKPVGVYALPEYPELKLQFPPFLEMLNFCYENDFSHIHSATPGPIGLAAYAIARILKLPFSGTYHTALPQYARYLTEDGDIEELVWKFTLWYYDQMDFIYAPSESTAQELIQKGISRDKLLFFPRGADTVRFNPSKRDLEYMETQYGITAPFKLLYVGRISKEKNLHLLAEVFRSICTMHHNVHLVLVGDGPYLDELQAKLDGTPCTFTGYLAGDDLAKVFASCDLFVFPSTTDTFGNVVLEAQASGLPVIVTDVGGPHENVISGKTGIITKGDDTAGLRRTIQSFLANPERLRQMWSAARRYMEGRSFEQAFEATWEMFDEKDDVPESPLAEAV
ncbi:MAG: glycosyltransferase [Deltaproteobacteria bacterium]|nr:glycosyltransferase [Deltaproteobacteria bacterium]